MLVLAALEYDLVRTTFVWPVWKYCPKISQYHDANTKIFPPVHIHHHSLIYTHTNGVRNCISTYYVVRLECSNKWLIPLFNTYLQKDYQTWKRCEVWTHYLTSPPSKNYSSATNIFENISRFSNHLFSRFENFRGSHCACASLLVTESVHRVASVEKDPHTCVRTHARTHT